MNRKSWRLADKPVSTVDVGCLFFTKSLELDPKSGSVFVFVVKMLLDPAENSKSYA